MMGAGAVVGFLFTPVNWKVMDDVAIWTQNWPWVPVPEDGETTYATSTCKLCPGACGIKVRLIDGKRAIKIEGDPQHPVNRGGICPLGLAGLQVVYGPDRIKSPLKRVGERGSGEWEEIGWGEAMSELSAKLSEQRIAGRPQSVAVIDGEHNGVMRRFWERFMTAYGSPNHVTMPILADTERAIGAAMHGVRRPMGYDLENSRYVMSFGADLIDGWGSGPRLMLAYSKWREGAAKLVHVSSTVSMSSSKAHEWVAVQPGAEPVLALGMAHVILKEGLAKGSGAGLEAFREMVEQYNPSMVALTTGVSAGDVRRLAREFATTPGAVAVWGRGKGEMPERLADAAAIQCLNGLVGAVGAAGGVAPQPMVPMAAWGSVPTDSVARAGLAAGRLDGATGVTSSLAHDFLAAAAKGAPYQINVLMVYEANPAYALANTSLYKDAAARIPFVVSFASSMDETVAGADLILPNHTYLERWDSSLTPPGLPYPLASLTQPVIDPLYDTRHTAEVMTQVAKAVGGSAAAALPWDGAEELVKSEVGELVGGGTFWCDEGARGPAGFRFSLDLPGGSVLPVYRSADLKGYGADYPLLLMPYANARITQAVANPPYMTKTIEDTVLRKKDLFVKLNPQDAKDAGVAEGDMLELTTVQGSVRVKAHLDIGTPPKVVEIPIGFGHTAQSKWIAGKGVNANDVLDVERDPLSGLARWNLTRARITKV